MAGNHTETRIKIARLLKQYREQAGLTIREAGKLLGKSNQTISAWENGRGQPDADMFLKLCDIYGVESVSLFFGEDIQKVDLSSEEHELLDAWNEATDSAKEAALMVLRCNKCQYIKKEMAITLEDKIDKEVAAYRADLELEARRAGKSSVSDAPDGDLKEEA